MNCVDIKEKLLKTTYFNDNKYLDLYSNLIFENLHTNKQKYITQSHHVIPCACYKDRKVAEKDINNFKVNLLFKDHIIAHYYLCLCSKNNQIKYKMIAAIEFILGKSKNTTNAKIVKSLKEWLLNSDIYQKEYEEFAKIRQNRLHNSTAREKARQKMLGHKTSEETRIKISKGNKGKKRSLELKKHLSEAHKGKPAWNKGKESIIKGKISVYNPKTLNIIYIKNEELNAYLTLGYLKGNPKSGRKDGSGTRNKKVICLEKNKIFDTIKEASLWCKGSVIQCLKGKAKTAGGYHWEYYDK